MNIIFFPFLLTALYLFMFAGSSLVQDPQLVVREDEETVANASCRTGNPIDDCWKCDRNWAQNRQNLASCVVGFGRNATGGKNGRIYVVTSPNDDPKNPRPGTLRYGVIQDEPLWIIFDRDMVIRLKEELLINSFKTIDGRGANVSVADGPCITIKLVTNVIIHGINIHGCDGDEISIQSSNYVWVDHCSLSNCEDGLIDVTHGSTGITISNNYMSHHDKVMLLGHSDDFTRDKNMYVTVAFNHFGEGLVQRMPRCRHGYFQVVYNDYTRWKMYAIGGSAAPTIISQGNRFLAPNNGDNKEVTKRYDAPRSEWKDWNWTSKGDLFLNGAYFLTSGHKFWPIDSNYTSLGNISSQVSTLTRDAGVLRCTKGSSCGSEPKRKALLWGVMEDSRRS